MGQAAQDEGGVVGDEGLAFDEFFKTGLPVFAELIGFRQVFPAMSASRSGQVVFRRTDVEVPRVFYLALIKFGQSQETDGVRLLIGKLDGDTRKVLGEAAEFSLFDKGILVVALFRFDVVLVEIVDFYVDLGHQVFFILCLAPLFSKGRRQGVENGADEDDGSDGGYDVDDGIHNYQSFSVYYSWKKFML